MDKIYKKNSKILSICCGGIVNQAIIVNTSALLYVAFMQLYQFSFIQVASITTAGFLAQLSADILLLCIIDKCNKNIIAKIACLFSAIGLLFYGCIPCLFTGQGIYISIVIATVIFAFSGGLLEIILSDTANKVDTTFAGVCLLHTIYAWAFACLSLLFFVYFILTGFAYWNYIIMLLAIIPIIIFVLMCKNDLNIGQSTLLNVKKENILALECNMLKKQSKKKKEKTFFIFFMLCSFLGVFFGYGAEIIVSQWVSTISAVLIDNDLYSMIGPALFAICLGAGGLIYTFILQKKRKIPLYLFLFTCCMGAISFFLVGFLAQNSLALFFLILSGLFVGVLSPSAMTEASQVIPTIGSWLFAILAISQDLSAAILPSLFGLISNASSIQFAFILSAIVPISAAIFMIILKKMKKRGE